MLKICKIQEILLNLSDEFFKNLFNKNLFWRGRERDVIICFFSVHFQKNLKCAFITSLLFHVHIRVLIGTKKLSIFYF